MAATDRRKGRRKVEPRVQPNVEYVGLGWIGQRAEPCIQRRDFIAAGVKTAAACVALPVLSLAGCGGTEQVEPAAQPAPQPKPAEKPAAAPTGSQSPPSPSANALVTELPAMHATVQALQYVNVSARPDQHCESCQLFTAGEGGLGKCQLFPQGRVKATGWCMSWVARAAPAAS